VRRGLRPCGFFASRRYFKHSGILPKFDNRAQIFFRLPNSLWVAHASRMPGFGIAPKRSFFKGRATIDCTGKVRDRETRAPS
jgi:hypothetical protein